MREKASRKQRMLVKGRSHKDIEKRVNNMKKSGWYPVSDIVLDPCSADGCDFVQVMEAEFEGRTSKWFEYWETV